MSISRVGSWSAGGKQERMTMDRQTTARERVEKYNLLYERFLRLGTPLTVILVCFAYEVGTYI
jgi:hypothetical protein